MVCSIFVYQTWLVRIHLAIQILLSCHVHSTNHIPLKKYKWNKFWNISRGFGTLYFLTNLQFVTCSCVSICKYFKKNPRRNDLPFLKAPAIETIWTGFSLTSGWHMIFSKFSSISSNSWIISPFVSLLVTRIISRDSPFPETSVIWKEKRSVVPVFWKYTIIYGYVLHCLKIMVDPAIIWHRILN